MTTDPTQVPEGWNERLALLADMLLQPNGTTMGAEYAAYRNVPMPQRHEALAADLRAAVAAAPRGGREGTTDEPPGLPPGEPEFILRLSEYEMVNLRHAVRSIPGAAFPAARLNNGDWLGQLRYRLEAMESDQTPNAIYEDDVAPPPAAPPGEGGGEAERFGVRYFVDAAGYVWREFPDGALSMARVNPDNEPIPEPRTYLHPEGALDRLAAMLGVSGDPEVDTTRYGGESFVTGWHDALTEVRRALSGYPMATRLVPTGTYEGRRPLAPAAPPGEPLDREALDAIEAAFQQHVPWGQNPAGQIIACNCGESFTDGSPRTANKRWGQHYVEAMNAALAPLLPATGGGEAGGWEALASRTDASGLEMGFGGPS